MKRIENPTKNQEIMHYKTSLKYKKRNYSNTQPFVFLNDAKGRVLGHHAYYSFSVTDRSSVWKSTAAPTPYFIVNANYSSNTIWTMISKDHDFKNLFQDLLNEWIFE